MSVSRTIRLARQRKDLTQEQVASALNIPCHMVDQWENGADTPDWSLISELSEILGVPTESLTAASPTASPIQEACRN